MGKQLIQMTVGQWSIGALGSRAVVATLTVHTPPCHCLAQREIVLKPTDRLTHAWYSKLPLCKVNAHTL